MAKRRVRKVAYFDSKALLLLCETSACRCFISLTLLICSSSADVWLPKSCNQYLCNQFGLMETRVEELSFVLQQLDCFANPAHEYAVVLKDKQPWCFSGLQNGLFSPSWTIILSEFKLLLWFRGSMCMSLRHVLAIGETVAKIWQYNGIEHDRWMDGWMNLWRTTWHVQCCV